MSDQISPEVSRSVGAADRALTQMADVYKAAYRLASEPERGRIERFMHTPLGRIPISNTEVAAKLDISAQRFSELGRQLEQNGTLAKLKGGSIDAVGLADCIELGMIGEAIATFPGNAVSGFKFKDGSGFDQFGQDMRKYLNGRTASPETYVEAVRILAEWANRTRFPASQKILEAAVTLTPLVTAGFAVTAPLLYEVLHRPSAESDRYSHLASWARSEIEIPKAVPQKKRPAPPPTAAPGPTPPPPQPTVPAFLRDPAEPASASPPHQSWTTKLGAAWQGGIAPVKSWWERVAPGRQLPSSPERGEPTEENPTELTIAPDTNQKITVYRQGTEYLRPDRDGVEWAGDPVSDSLYHRALTIAGLDKTEQGHSSPRIVVVETDHPADRVGICISIHVENTGRGRPAVLGMTLVTSPDDADRLYQLVSANPDALFPIMRQVHGGRMFTTEPKAVFRLSSFITFLPDVKHADTPASYARTVASPQLSEGEFSPNVQI